MADTAESYAFPHTGTDERRRLELLEERLDPITVRRIERLQLAPGARCLEVGGGRGSVARWLGEPDFLACGFAHIGAWGRRPAPPATGAGGGQS